MAKFQHFILTRFNLRMKGYSHDRQGNPLLSDEWLKHRLALFERFCYPSIVNQSTKNFRWLVALEADTAPRYREQIEAYRGFENFTPIYTPTRFRDAIKANLEDDTELLITTRLDADDAFHRDAVQIIQQHICGHKLEFLNFPLGYQYLYPEGQLFLRAHLSNAFISLVERLTAEPFNTVHCGPHLKLHERGPVTQLDFSPSWLQVVHDRNLTNKLKYDSLPCGPVSLHDLFGVPG